jgi:hypothetical protein
MNSKQQKQSWPVLHLADWKPTCETLHMWSQIVGKVRLALSPPLNHWWQVPLYVNARGLTTSAIPYERGIFEVQFDFLDHRLEIKKNSGESEGFALEPRPVAEFYHLFMDTLARMNIRVKIWPVPVEIPNPIPFEKDSVHASYDRAAVERFFRALVLIDEVFKEFRCEFIGKCSPVHFFWGSFDLAVTRFSGRRAPARPDADPITKEAYSHEVISAGFWPGSGEIQDAAFYAYAAPEPQGFSEAKVLPEQAYYHSTLREFLLMYEDVRTSSSPFQSLMSFLESTYDAGAELGEWDRSSLERQPS